MHGIFLCYGGYLRYHFFSNIQTEIVKVFFCCYLTSYIYIFKIYGQNLQITPI